MSNIEEKKQEQVSNPDQLNDYIRVTTPSIWLVLAALALLLIGILIWSIFGTVEGTAADGTTEEFRMISLVIN